MKNSKLLLSALMGLGLYSASAQEFSVDAMIRPRFEYRNGFQTVQSDGGEPAAFVSQRSSVKFKYTDAKIQAYIDLQDASVWGDRGQITSSPENFRVQEAWAKIALSEKWSIKAGRQNWSYDDQRILGGLGWLQQARTHDGILFGLKSGSFKGDFGFAFNQNSETISNTIYTEEGNAGVNIQYKSMQFLHLHNKFSDAFNASFLFMNNSFQDATAGATDDDGNLLDATPGTNSRQLTGIHANYKSGAFGASGSFYTQFGEIWSPSDAGALDVKGAIEAKIDFTYKPASTLFGIGYEYMSGDDNPDDDEINAFFPLFGTNHKFNGFMDLFYVFNNFGIAGNGANSFPGLQDVYGKTVIKTGEKSSLLAKGHLFATAADPAAFSGYIGAELDLVFTQKITPYALAKFGYSHAILDEDFANARSASGTASDLQNWGWVMLVVKPNLFKWKKPVE